MHVVITLNQLVQRSKERRRPRSAGDFIQRVRRRGVDLSQQDVQQRLDVQLQFCGGGGGQQASGQQETLGLQRRRPHRQQPGRAVRRLQQRRDHGRLRRAAQLLAQPPQPLQDGRRPAARADCNSRSTARRSTLLCEQCRRM